MSSILAGTVVALSGCGGASPAAADAPVILRLALNQTEKHPSYVALSSFDKRLQAATRGRCRIDIFPNEVLGARSGSRREVPPPFPRRLRLELA